MKDKLQTLYNKYNSMDICNYSGVLEGDKYCNGVCDTTSLILDNFDNLIKYLNNE